MIALALALSYLGTLAFVAFLLSRKTEAPPAEPGPSLEPRVLELEETVSELSLKRSRGPA